MGFKMKGWSGYQNSPVKHPIEKDHSHSEDGTTVYTDEEKEVISENTKDVKGREGTTYVVDKMAVIKDPVRNTKQISDKPMYEGHHRSSHLMGDDNKTKAYPTLFQDESGGWYRGGEKEAKRKGELYEFDTEKEMIDFARKGNWKDKHFKNDK